MNIVAPNLLSFMIYASDAHKVWEDLHERFDKVNASRSFYLHKEIGKLTQESKQNAEHYQLRKLYQFLTRLNDTFDNAKDQILMTRPVPNINQAYAMIINVERHRRNNSTVGVGDPTTLLSYRVLTGGYNRGYKPRNNFGKSSLQCDFAILKVKLETIVINVMVTPLISEVGKEGGGPPDSKGAYAHTASIAPASCTQQGGVGNVVSSYSSATDSSSATAGVSSAPFFTQDQYNQILHMLNKGKQVDTVANSATVNTTGTITALMSHLVSNNWIIDTGATNHMDHNLNQLSNIRKLLDSDQNSIQLPNGEKVIISDTGDLSLFKDKSVHHELFTGKVMGISKEEHGLYILKHKEQDIPKQLNACSINAFDLIHADVWGPYRVPTHNGRSQKSVLLQCQVSKVNNGTEFFNNQVTGLLQEHGIVHQSTCVYTPQQNGRVERRHRFILDMARALRLPTIVLNGVSPFERLFHKSPSLNHLRVFGSLCYSTNLKKTYNFCRRAIPAVHLCYSSIQKGYVLYDLSSPLLIRNVECPALHSSDSFNPSASPCPSMPPLNNQPSLFFPSPPPTDNFSSSSLLLSAPADLRRSSRVTKPPIWMEDYIVLSKSSSSAHPISQCVTHSPTCKASLAAYSAITVSRSYDEAKAHPKWIEAMRAEISALEANRT
ncbi:PREDICTED: uncharacterized protein LOC109236707 [Nicotiana attenuata]|uniref:uncharacterized protein LOC109236707 n=1 Tax=Nicotiana attenuata TaxID=49451 RepID=UPI000904AD3C|nr:PREDICTED: uncharacterized protein LOC109236707 [Nicotiana attenuata]